MYGSLSDSQHLQQPRVVMFLINSSGFSYLSTQRMNNEIQPPPTLPKGQGANSSLDFVFFIGLVLLQNGLLQSLTSETGHEGFGPMVGQSQPQKAQSILSTLPRILPSYMGSTVSSSQISSKTAPQANSSLAFLK